MPTASASLTCPGHPETRRPILQTAAVAVRNGIIGLLLGIGAPALALEVGDVAPAFNLPGAAGPVKLEDFRGKVIYVDFWASWCVPCRQSMPWLNEMHSKYSARGLRVVGIGVDERASDADAFLTAYPARFTVAFDLKGAVPPAYGVKGMPSSALIDRTGRLRFQHTGFRNADRAELERQIQQVLGTSE